MPLAARVARCSPSAPRPTAPTSSASTATWSARIASPTARCSRSRSCRVADLGILAAQYSEWLQSTQGCRFSSIANYLNGLISVTSYCYAELEVSDAVFNMEPNPLAQLINLRGQAEKASKQQNMFDKRVGGWIEWEDVQKARVTAIGSWTRWERTAAAMRNALRDAPLSRSSRSSLPSKHASVPEPLLSSLRSCLSSPPPQP